MCLRQDWGRLATAAAAEASWNAFLALSLLSAAAWVIHTRDTLAQMFLWCCV